MLRRDEGSDCDEPIEVLALGIGLEEGVGVTAHRVHHEPGRQRQPLAAIVLSAQHPAVSSARAGANGGANMRDARVLGGRVQARIERGAVDEQVLGAVPEGNLAALLGRAPPRGPEGVHAAHDGRSGSDAATLEPAAQGTGAQLGKTGSSGPARGAAHQQNAMPARCQLDRT